MTQYRMDSHYSIQHNAHEVWIDRYSRNGPQETLIWQWATHPPGTVMPEPTRCHMDSEEHRAFFQAALDRAWALGLRPAHYEEPKETVALVNHLQDMRRLVFKEQMAIPYVAKDAPFPGTVT